MYTLHTQAKHGHYIDSEGTRWDVHIATNPYPVEAWDVFDTLAEAVESYKLTEIPNVPLYDAKLETMELIQKWIDLSVVAKKEIPCEALGESIVFDRQALINAMNVKPGLDWIGSSNVPHKLDEALLKGIQETLFNYVQSIYIQATEWRVGVSNATTLEEVQSIINAVTDAWPKGEKAPELNVTLTVKVAEKKAAC